MSQSGNEPVINRPPVTADVAPPGEMAEAASQTRIGKFKLPTASLRAYTMLFALVLIWLYFQWATGGIFLSPRNFSNLFQQMSVTGVLAVGMLMEIGRASC